MKLLIDPQTKVYSSSGDLLGSKVCYYYEEEFEVASPLFFVDNPAIDFTVRDPQWCYYNDDTGEIGEVPYVPPPPPPKSLEQMLEEMVAERLKAMQPRKSQANTGSSNTA